MNFSYVQFLIRCLHDRLPAFFFFPFSFRSPLPSHFDNYIVKNSDSIIHVLQESRARGEYSVRFEASRERKSLGGRNFSPLL